MKTNPYLSKSDFQLAKDCAKKLDYRKRAYPSVSEDDAYMEMLARGGYIVGKMATMLYPEGLEITGNTQAALEQTRLELLNEDATLFEAAIASEGKLIRADILLKRGRELHLIEVKSASLNGTKPNMKKLKNLVEDAAFQYLVLQEAYPNMELKVSLLMPDISKYTDIEGLASWFYLEDEPQTPAASVEMQASEPSRFRKPGVVFRYDDAPNRSEYVERLRKEGILGLLDITQVVIDRLPQIQQRAGELLEVMKRGVGPGDYTLSKACRDCPFKVHESVTPNGFAECWASLPNPEHHVFDLYHIGSVGGSKKGYLLDKLIEEGRLDLTQLRADDLCDATKTIAYRTKRQLLQIEHTRAGTEWVDESLPALLQGLQYPLHFVDFETYSGAVPLHAGMRPYESIAFQWSCHTLTEPGGDLLHSEWIQQGKEFPNFEFARSLMRQTGMEGTVLMWATHEHSILKTILQQTEIRKEDDPELRNWLEFMTRENPENTARKKGRLLNMNRLAEEFYFHPLMKGQTSIKKVLPAVWKHQPALRRHPWFSEYVLEDASGYVPDPYEALGLLAAVRGESSAVKHGTDALQAYYRLFCVPTLSDDERTAIYRDLLAYCKLDTLAMVMIWKHWVGG